MTCPAASMETSPVTTMLASACCIAALAAALWAACVSAAAEKLRIERAIAVPSLFRFTSIPSFVATEPRMYDRDGRFKTPGCPIQSGAHCVMVFEEPAVGLLDAL